MLTIWTPSPSAVEITLTWTSAGDDGPYGTPAGYDIRWTLDPTSSWDTWQPIGSYPTPDTGGSPMSHTFTILVETEQEVSFALTTYDEIPNYSTISNVAMKYIPDDIAPGQTLDVEIQ